MTDHTSHIADAKRLERSDSDRMLAGVAGGLARYFDIHPAFFRVGLRCAHAARRLGAPHLRGRSARHARGEVQAGLDRDARRCASDATARGR